MALIVTLTSPEGCFRSKVQQAFGLHVELTQSEVGITFTLLGIEVTNCSRYLPSRLNRWKLMANMEST